MKKVFIVLIILTLLAVFGCKTTAKNTETSGQTDDLIDEVSEMEELVGETEKAVDDIEEEVEQDIVGDKPETEESKLDGKELVDERCTVCHDTTRIFNEDYDLDGWEKTVNRMVLNGAEINSDEEKQAILDYLITL